MRFCDQILVIEHSPNPETEKVAHEYGAIVKPAILGVDDGAYTVDCDHDWIFCILPVETVSETLEAELLDWKESEHADVPGFSVLIREQTNEDWRSLGREVRLANRKRVNWKDKLPPMIDGSCQLNGDILRFND